MLLRRGIFFWIRQDPPKEITKGFFNEILNTSIIDRPVDYLHLADTTSRGRQGIGAQQFHFFRIDKENEVHGRHNNRANGLFIDGHVEGTNRRRLEDLGISGLFGKDEIPGYFREP